MSSHLARLEALLFVAGEDGLSLRTMAQLLEMPVTGLTQSLEKLQAKYEDRKSTRQNSSHGVQSRMPSSA